MQRMCRIYFEICRALKDVGGLHVDPVGAVPSFHHSGPQSSDEALGGRFFNKELMKLLVSLQLQIKLLASSLGMLVSSLPEHMRKL